jgi:hypothetical protein
MIRNLHISPCAWYCFEIGDGESWRVEERDDHTLLTAPDGSCTIEIAAARRTSGISGTSGTSGSTDNTGFSAKHRADEDEIAGIHERYLREEGIQPLKTALAENPHRIAAYVTRGLGMDEREHIVCHAWWNNYCAFIKYRGRRERSVPGRIRAFYDLVDSLQPLVEG